MEWGIIGSIMLFVSALGFSQKSDGDDGTILPGRDYSFILKEPSGWVIDVAAAKPQGLEAVLYPEGSSWKKGVAVMYARLIYKDETQPTVEKVISHDVSDFLKQSHESRVSESEPLTTGDKKTAVVKGFYVLAAQGRARPDPSWFG